jgi:hypothetical protein
MPYALSSETYNNYHLCTIYDLYRLLPEHRSRILELQDSLQGQMEKKRWRVETHSTESIQRIYTQVDTYPPHIPSHFVSSPAPPGFHLRFFHLVRLSSPFLSCLSSSLIAASLIAMTLDLLSCFSSSISPFSAGTFFLFFYCMLHLRECNRQNHHTVLHIYTLSMLTKS